MNDPELVDGLGVASERSGNCTIFHLAGELDLVSAPRLRAALTTLRSQPADAVVLDLSGLTYIDSVGIGLLVATRRGLDADGRSFSVRNPRPQVLRLLEITGLVEYLGLTQPSP